MVCERRCSRPVPPTPRRLGAVPGNKPLAAAVTRTDPLLSPLPAPQRVELPLKLTNLKKAERIEYVTTAPKLGLGDRLHHLPRRLSGGQEERDAIVLSLIRI